MKKQRKPIILVLVLAALCGGAAIMNKPASTGPGAPPPAKDSEPEKKGDVASDVAANVAGTKPEPKDAGGPKLPSNKRPGMGGPHGPPGMDGPSILRPKITPYKPKPSDSATSTQWYTDESPRK